MINSSPIPQILPLTFNLFLLLAGAGISLQAADPTAYVSSYFQDVITTVDPTTGATKKLGDHGLGVGHTDALTKLSINAVNTGAASNYSFDYFCSGY